jgi:hypothetical membrane protein
MNTRLTTIVALAANLLFWPALFVFAALRPDYSHFTNAVSELGSFGAPRMWAWNVVGFIVPGSLIAITGWRIGRRIEANHYVLTAMLVLSGAMVVLAGLAPADMADRHGTATNIHLIGANGSLLAWVIALVLLAIRIRGARRYEAIVAIIALLCLAGVLLLADHTSLGLTQRLIFAIFFFSFAVLSLAPQEQVQSKS